MNARRWSITVSACLLVLLGLGAFKYTQIKAAIAFSESFPEPSASVQSITVSLVPIQHYVRTIGEVMAPEQMMLRNELAGRVTAVDMVSGQLVQKGQRLLQLDVADDQARLNAALANARLVKIKLARQQRLLKSNTTSQDNVDQAQAEYDIAQATVAELNAVIRKKTLLAPFDASVGLHNLEVGEYLNANTDLVELVGRSETLWVDFNLPLHQGQVAIGNKVNVIGQGAAIDAVVIARNAAVSMQSRNLRYRAEFAAEGIPPNSVVDLRVPTAKLEGVEVPSPAILRDQLGSYVFRLEPEADGQGYRAQRQSVTLGREENTLVEIIAGLSPGDVVATDGAFKLQHGMLTYIRSRPEGNGDEQPNGETSQPELAMVGEDANHE